MGPTDLLLNRAGPPRGLVHQLIAAALDPAKEVHEQPPSPSLRCDWQAVQSSQHAAGLALPSNPQALSEDLEQRKRFELSTFQLGKSWLPTAENVPLNKRNQGFAGILDHTQALSIVNVSR